MTCNLVPEVQGSLTRHAHRQMVTSLGFVRLQAVSFNVAAISRPGIKTKHGVANEAADDENMLLTDVQPGTALSDVALFIDHNRDSMPRTARPER